MRRPVVAETCLLALFGIATPTVDQRVGARLVGQFLTGWFQPKR
jgi:hypothetical protein